MTQNEIWFSIVGGAKIMTEKGFVAGSNIWADEKLDEAINIITNRIELRNINKEYIIGIGLNEAIEVLRELKT